MPVKPTSFVSVVGSGICHRHVYIFTGPGMKWGSESHGRHKQGFCQAQMRSYVVCRMALRQVSVIRVVDWMTPGIVIVAIVI